MHRLLLYPVYPVLAITATQLLAQTPGPVTKAVATITAADVSRHIYVIADDSMMGRNTPSRGLELTARYVADQFKKFGLKPGGDNGTWFQRYPIPNDTVTAPNTVGILEGDDPKLKKEYLVFSAHMDHIGIARGGVDSINNGASDNGSGTAGLIEVAEALSRAGVRLRRSVIFLAVSGEEKGLWGSRYFVEHPVVPIGQIVANLNLDGIGRIRGDTVAVIGKHYSDLGATLDRVDAAHPDPYLTPVGDPWPEDQLFYRSDHYSFARQGIPSLFFTGAGNPDVHAVTDSPDKIDAEKEVHVLRLVFHLGRELANVDQRPRWDPASYQRIVKP